MKYVIKPEFQGLIISTRVFIHNVTLTLDASKNHSQETLANYYRHEEFRQFIDVIEKPKKNPNGTATEKEETVSTQTQD